VTNWSKARFLNKAIRSGGLPEKPNMDKSGASKAAVEAYNKQHGAAIEVRQNKYLNNGVEQGHRGVKRIVRPMLSFESFRRTLAGIELARMLRKG
jgi:putative transposase